MNAFVIGKKAIVAVQMDRRATSVADFVAQARAFRSPTADIPASERVQVRAEFAEIGEISGRGIRRSVLNRLPW